MKLCNMNDDKGSVLLLFSCSSLLVTYLHFLLKRMLGSHPEGECMTWVLHDIWYLHNTFKHCFYFNFRFKYFFETKLKKIQYASPLEYVTLKLTNSYLICMKHDILLNIAPYFSNLIIVHAETFVFFLHSCFTKKNSTASLHFLSSRIVFFISLTISVWHCNIKTTICDFT